MKLNYVLQARFDSLSKIDIEKSFSDLVSEKGKYFHYDIRLENIRKQNTAEIETSYDSWSLFPDTKQSLEKVQSGKFFFKESDSVSWMKSASEKELAIKISKGKKGYAKIFTLEKGLYTVDSWDEDAVTLKFEGGYLRGFYKYESTDDDKDYFLFKKVGDIEEVKKPADEVSKKLTSLHKKFSKTVLNDIKLSRYTLEDAKAAFPQLIEHLV